MSPELLCALSTVTCIRILTTFVWFECSFPQIRWGL